MSSTDLTRRYSKALFQLASTKEERQKLLDEMDKFIHVLKNAPDSLHFLSLPQISPAKKNQLIKMGLGKHFDPLFLEFVNYLFEKRRFQFLPDIFDSFRKMVEKEQGIIEGNLVTAEAVEKDLKEKLKKELEKIYQKEIILNEEIDPGLLGGGILTIANHLIDFSVRGKLERLKEDLLAINMEKVSNAAKT